MSDAPSPAKRQRRTTASLTALRHLAREAAEAGEPMREIARRHGLEKLSMGMSGDYEIAIEFGATHVRVGTAIFGDRLKPAG